MAATDLERLVVQLSADVKKYENALNRAMGVTNQRARLIENRFKKLSSNVNASLSSAVARVAAITGGALGVREIQQYADAWTSAGNKIAAAAQIAGVQTRSLEDLKAGADEARTSFEDYVDLYAKLIRSSSGVAKSEQEIATATSLVSKAFKAGGAAAHEQAAGILQLGQALGSGVLQGDELRSLRENAPVLAQAIADEFKTTIAGLKDLGAEGKLTSDRVFQAILNAQSKIEGQFNATNATIADGFTKLRNSVTEYIGQTASAIGLTEAINGVLAALSGHIDSVANAAAAAGIALAATFGGGAIAAGAAALLNPFVLLAAAVGTAAFAITELWDNIVPLQGSFATLGDYATALWQVLSQGATEAQAAVVSAFDTVVSSIDGALNGLGTSMEGVWDVVKSGVNAIINSFIRLKDVVVATFQLVPAAVGEAVVGAMNSMIAGVEAGINKIISAVNRAANAINSLSEFAGISVIPTVDSVSLSRIENSYAGAGEKASKAFADAFGRESVDYVGAAGDAISGSVDKATAAIIARANEVAAKRQELERETNKAGNFGGVAKPSNKGFGGGTGLTADGSGSGGKKGGGRKGRGGESDFQREIDQIKERTAALQAETAAQAQVNPLIDDYGYAVEYAAAKQDLLNAAKREGLAITPELEASINALAEGYAKASAAAEQLQERQSDVKKAADDFKNSAKDITSGFISDLRSGKSAAEALAGALDKVVDKLIDVALNSAFGISGSGGGGGLLGGLFSIFGFAKGGIAARGRPQPLKKFARGGVSRSAAIFGEAGPEAAVPLPDGRSIPVKFQTPAVPKRSSAGQQAVDVQVGVTVDDDGKLQAYVKRESNAAVTTAAPKILSAANQQAPAAVSKYQQQKGGAEWR